MMTIKDLSSSKELDSKAMAGMSGGNGLGIDLSEEFDLTSFFNNQTSTTAAVTGPQTIYDQDVAVAGHGGIAFNYSNNSNSAYADAVSLPVNVAIEEIGGF